MKTKTDYSEKLQDGMWLKRKLEIHQRDNWKCQGSGQIHSVGLEVHHVDYWEGKEPWEYDNDSLITACRKCHEQELIRFKHEQSLLNSLKYAGFLAVDIHALSCMLLQKKEFTESLKKQIRQYSKG